MKRILYAAILLISLTFYFFSPAWAQGVLPSFERDECPIEVPNGPSIKCGYLYTLEDYENPQGRTIRLPVIIIHSRSANPLQEALLFTEGGPGYSSLGSVWWLADSEFANQRDIVILEQRGNKYADPSLACDISVWSEDQPGTTPCLDSLQSQGIPLEQYTSAAIAADLDALRQALDYETWSLFGTSYSTRLMQLVLAQDPPDIRSVVLQSTNPIADYRFLHDPEHAARALQRMFADCAAAPACAEAYPDLEAKFYRLVRELNDEPVAFEFHLVNGTEKFTVEVNGDTLISWMVGAAFYGPAYPPHATAYLPLLIEAGSQGNTDLLYPWSKEYIARWANDSFVWGLYFAVNCQDDAPHIDAETVAAQIAAYPELDGYYRHRAELAICDAWNLDPAPLLAAEPVVSDIPVLILGGAYDPITPPEWGRKNAANLRNHVFVEFPSLGHSVFSDNPCAEHITAAFLDDPTQELDLSCMQDVPDPDFVLPKAIILAPAMYEIHYGELGYSQREENLFLTSWLTLLAAGAIALVVTLVNWIRRRNRSQPETAARLAPPLLIVLSLTALVWGYALRFALQSLAATAPITLRFGLPAAYWWLFAIALMIGLLSVALVLFVGLAWIRKYGSLLGRIALSCAALAAVIFSSVLANWGLFTALFR